VALAHLRAGSAILACHVSNVAKLVSKVRLPSRGHVRDGALDRSEVEALAERRAQETEALTSRPRRKYQRVEHRPDTDHEWLSPRQVAVLPGCDSAGGPGPHPPRDACRRERWPVLAATDLLEQVEAARLVRKTVRTLLNPAGSTERAKFAAA